MSEKQWEKPLLGLGKYGPGEALFWASGAAVDPELHLGDGVGTGERRKCAAFAGIPAPTDQIVSGDMLEELGERAASGLPGIFELPAELGGRAADEDHLVFGRRQGPLGIAGRHVLAGEIGGLVTSVATHAVNAMAILATLDVLQMGVAVIAL